MEVENKSHCTFTARVHAFIWSDLCKINIICASATLKSPVDFDFDCLGIRPTSSAQNREVREKCLNVLNLDIFLTKTYRFTTGGLYSPPGAVLGLLFFWMDALLFDYFWTVEQKHPPTVIK